MDQPTSDKTTYVPLDRRSFLRSSLLTSAGIAAILLPPAPAGSEDVTPGRRTQQQAVGQVVTVRLKRRPL